MPDPEQNHGHDHEHANTSSDDYTPSEVVQESSAEHQSGNSNNQDLETGKPTRERRFTDKGKAYHLQKREKAFSEAVGNWKKSVNSKDPSEEEITATLSIVEHAYSELKELIDAGAAAKCNTIMNRVRNRTEEMLQEIRETYSIDATLDEILSELDDAERDDTTSLTISKSPTSGLEETFDDSCQLTRRKSEIKNYNCVKNAETTQSETSAAQFEPASASALAEVVDRLELPKDELPKFDGDPLKYKEFIITFKDAIDSKRIPEETKLRKLVAACVGKAREAIKPCLFMQIKGYASALEILQNRYGDPIRIARAHVRQLTSGSQVKSDEDIVTFADQVRTCMLTLTALGRSNDIDTQESIAAIVNRLPTFIQNRWRKMAVSVKFKSGEYPTFKEFSDFLTIVGMELDDELFGRKSKTTPHSQPTNRHEQRGKVRTLAHQGDAKYRKSNSRDAQLQLRGTQTSVQEKCPLCALTHKIEDCTNFKGLPLEGRKMAIRENGLCFACLRTGHLSKNCPQRATCTVCWKRHPTLLHIYDVSAKDEDSPVDQISGTTGSLKKTSRDDTESTSMIVPVWVSHRSSSKELLTYALLDTQSNVSFISEELAENLNVPCESISLKLSTIVSASEFNCHLLKDLNVREFSSTSSVRVKRCYTRNELSVPSDHIPTRDTATSWPHLKEIVESIPPKQNCPVGLLLGYDCHQALQPLKMIPGDETRPFAVKTPLGWSIVGTSNRTEERACFRINVRECPSIERLVDVLETDFKDAKTNTPYSQEDIQFVRIMESELKQEEDGHLKMPLPLKKTAASLPNNRTLALQRLQSLKRRFQGDASFLDRYSRSMQDMLERGFAERIIEDSPPKHVWYIPHHAVFHPKKDKLRVVFDCSACANGTSLNDVLLKGPDLINSLPGILMRFRTHEVAFTCDVEKMFLQFRVDESSRDYLRFLWFPGGDITQKPLDYRMTVHLFGASSSPACANFGLRHLAHLSEDSLPLGAKFVEHNFYVDDGVGGASTVGVAAETAAQATAICARGGLRLCQFACNDPTFFEELLKRGADSTIAHPEVASQTVLGLRWETDTDTIGLQAAKPPQAANRRGLLSSVASVFDPLGLLSPVVLIGKQLLQELCSHGIDWDDPIPQELQEHWRLWLEALSKVEQLTLPRRIHPFGDLNNITVQLHHFSDACLRGYGQCSYIRLLTSSGIIHCALLYSKSRVAPRKAVSVPRLELTAAVVSAETSQLLKQELNLKINQEYFWTDSQVVLGYIRNEARRFHIFVANRVQMIHDKTDVKRWFHVPTDQNPADIASRGATHDELLKSIWFDGPPFLRESTIEPILGTVPELTPDDPEVKAQTFATTALEDNLVLKKLAKFSNWNSALKGYSLLIKKVIDIKGQETENRTLNSQAKRKAENLIIKQAQLELDLTKIAELRPFLDEFGILRVGGRIGRAQLPEEVKHPVILPKSSHVSRLIALHHHERIHHQGRGQTCNAIRSSGYWIVSMGRLVRSIVQSCTICRRHRRPVETQRMADLPEPRVEASPPFTDVGMDCFGNFFVRRGRSELKRYGLILTCLSSRAVHIEMLEDLSADSLIKALRRFISLRGAVRSIHCDRGSNFVGASNEFETAKKHLETFLDAQNCEFHFNAPKASHAGGSWERQIRTIRNVLEITLTLSKKQLTDSCVQTLFYEAAAIVNSRPLSPVNLEDPLSDPPITPNHLLTMKCSISPAPLGHFVHQDLFARKSWRRVQYLLEQFWCRWRREYLLNLQSRKKWSKKERNIVVGDIVLLHEDAPRMKWPMGIVTGTRPSQDGFVRRIRIRLANRNLNDAGVPVKQPSELERPVQKVVLLLPNSDI